MMVSRKDGEERRRVRRVEWNAMGRREDWVVTGGAEDEDMFK